MAIKADEFSGVLLKSPLRVDAFRHAVASSFAYDKPSGTVSGCLYDSEGVIIEQSQRIGGLNGDRIVSSNPPSYRNSCKNRVVGKSLYLGNWMGQYGHFILESTSALWALRNKTDYDHYLFHPFIFGAEVKQWQIDILGIFGISQDRIVILREPTLLETIDVPTRALIINHSAAKEMRWVIDEIVKMENGDLLSGNPIFLSRGKVKDERKVLNSKEVEEAFEENGFEIIHPEELSFFEQINLIRRAPAIAGFSGSAMHNTIFAREDTIVVDLGDARSLKSPLPSQLLCNSISNPKYYFIRPKQAYDAQPFFDIDKLKGELSDIL